MSSKRLTMENLMRLTRSQTKAKKANKALNNIATTEPSVSGYNATKTIRTQEAIKKDE